MNGKNETDTRRLRVKKTLWWISWILPHRLVFSLCALFPNGETVVLASLYACTLFLDFALCCRIWLADDSFSKSKTIDDCWSMDLDGYLCLSMLYTHYLWWTLDTIAVWKRKVEVNMGFRLCTVSVFVYPNIKKAKKCNMIIGITMTLKVTT